MTRRRAAVTLVAGVLAVAAGLAFLGSGGALRPDTVTARGVLAVPSVGGGSVLTRARVQSPDAYRAAVATGAQIAGTPDGRSFFVQWPRAFRGGPTIVSFHGYLSTAFDDFLPWQKEAKRRGWRVIDIQWRLGKTRSQSYTPAQMYSQARTLLRRAGVPAGQALVHGYSSAASRVYGLAGIDRRANRLFALFIGDAGGALPNYPGYREVFQAPAGRKTLAGTHWVLFCGGRDPDPNLTGCPVMRRTRAKIVARGGVIERFIIDPGSNHGGFHENPANQSAALDVFARLLGR